MNTKSSPIQILALSAALCAGVTSLSMAGERDPLVSTIDAVMAGYATRGEWTSPLASTETSEEKDALVATIGAVMAGYATRGEWSSPLSSIKTVEQKDAPSADTILTALVQQYDRASLDRGGWVNAFVNDVGYDSGNALLAISPGEGVTSQAQSA